MSDRPKLTPFGGSSSYSRKDFDHSPLVLFYELTQACDLVCKHCRACAQPTADPRELKPAESLELLKQISQFPKPPLLVLTGGDPLKRPDIYALIEYATSLGMHVAVTPSATPLVTRDAVARLKQAGVSRLAISLDGATAASHDEMRGVDGSFAKTLEILEMAREFQIPSQVNSTITRRNFEEIDDIAELISTYDIVLWSVFFLIPVGRGTELQRLDANQCEDAFERLWDQSLRRPYAIKTTEAPHYRRFLLQRKKEQSVAKREETSRPARLPAQGVALGVNDGRGAMFVGHRGEVYPSGFMPLLCGKFPQEDVVDIYQNSPMMKLLRDSDQLKGKCGWCEYRNVCGGSRARTYALTGDPMESEPDCIYEPTQVQSLS